MIIRTKKYRLPKKVYRRIAFANMVRHQWWLPTLLLLFSGALWYMDHAYWGAFFTFLTVLYFVYRWVQVYFVTKVQDNQLIFQSLSYQISSKEVIIQVTTKRGAPLAWKQFKPAKQPKKAFLLLMEKAQFLYLPYRIFRNKQEVRFVKMLLKRKKLVA